MARRVALLVATGEYSDPLLGRLRAPAQDVHALAEVLADPGIGDFSVEHLLVDRGRQEVEEAIEDCLADRKPGDIALMYFSCHGVKDPHGRLYFAAANTRVDRLASTAVSSVFVNEQMERCRASAKVAILDCCYSGAFVRGLAAKTGRGGDLANQICGRGSYVITATNGLEYAYEKSDIVEDHAVSSSFTDVIVRGLRSGEADWDGDGLISPEDLFWFLDKHFRSAGLPQTPTSFSSGVQGAVAIAKAPGHTGQAADDIVAATADLRRWLADLEIRYTSIREVLPSGGRRTALLDDIVGQAGALAAGAQRLGLLAPRLTSFAQDSEGARIVTLALCGRLAHPDAAAVIVDGIRNSRSAFEQYWALTAATSVLSGVSQRDRLWLRAVAKDMLESGVLQRSTDRILLVRMLLDQTAGDED